MKLIKNCTYPTYALEDGRIFRPSVICVSFKFGRFIKTKLPDKYLGGSKLSPKGYARVNIPGIGPKFLHRIIAETLIPNPLNLPQVNHKDGNKLNNAVSNLEWCTNSDNKKHAVLHNLIARSFDLPQTKLSGSDKSKIKKRAQSGELQRHIAKDYNIVQQTVSKILRSENA